MDGSPTPEESSGLARPEATSVSRHLLWIPRILFYVPRRALELAFTPARELSYAWERFQIPQRFKQVFFNDKETFGIYPVAFIDTGFGLNGGVRLVHRDLFSGGEGLLLRASFGGRYEQFYYASINSGNRLGRVSLSLGAGYEVGPQDAFFGFGNGEEVAKETVLLPIDPRRDDTAIRTQFKRNRTHVKLKASTRLTSWLAVALSSEVRIQYLQEKAKTDDTGDYFQADKLVGLGDGTADVYSQLQVTFDNRVTAHPYMSKAISSRGLYAAGWLGYARGFHGDPSNHLRYSLDLQYFFDLYRGDRVLIVRMLLDGVTADLDRIPFMDLPTLGGANLLRGYDFDRFRDRVTTLMSFEYQYNLTFGNTAFVFIDLGRVWRSLEDFRLKKFRMGYGGGIIFHSNSAFLARIQLSSSIDGGFFLHIGFDPIYTSRNMEEPR